MGWQNVFQVEIDPWCQQLLTQNFPDATRYTDIRQFDGSPYSGRIDVLSGGFPCQPYSTAGQRKGKEDERHLWPEMRRVIREISPRWVVGENVRGLTNWNGGLVFDEVQANLEAEGYEVTPFLLPAAGVGAPHERYRIWFIAHANNAETTRQRKHSGQVLSVPKPERLGLVPQYTDVADTNSQHEGYGYNGKGPAVWTEKTENESFWNPVPHFDNWPTQPGICGRNDGIPHRLDRVKGLGNAVVPQVVMQIFKAIQEYDNL